jgi:predicted MPP superfamily phosphohydrolase
MTKSSFAIFLTTVLSIWAVLHAFVFWRLANVSWISNHLSARSLALIAFIGWISYPAARILHARQIDTLANPLEIAATTWIGIVFLLFAALLVTEIVTLGGVLFASTAPRIRGGAVVIALVCAALALVQGFRPPVLREYTVEIPDLATEHDGLVIIHLSDLHLGTMLGRSWLEHIVRRVTELEPDLVVVSGDLIDGDVGRVEPFWPALRELRAPLGVWAVTGNHEIYAGYRNSVRLLESAGYRVLCDRWQQAAPGLVIAGVDDLTARGQLGIPGDPVATALADRPADATTILLSHSPMQAEQASEAGVDLMLSGHTHAGQIWPFGYLVGLRYRLLAGRYRVGDMTAIVCRGTGTWGPRMRLWRPSEFNRITLRRPTAPAS